jgi:autotransporter passenger strand-loop-strand repeat protein
MDITSSAAFGTASDTTMNSGATMNIIAGVASDTTMNSGAKMYIKGGVASDTTMNDGATMTIYDGVASATTISSGATMNISGGVASDTTISGGGMYVFDGGTAKGTMEIASDATVSAYSGATIDFTVAEQVDKNAALINHYDYIKGSADATFTLTVKVNQASGQYALADYAQSFTSTITARTPAGDTLGTISLDGNLASGYNNYSLTRNDAGRLLLTVKTNIASNPDANADGSFDEAVLNDDYAGVVFDSHHATYNYSDGLTLTHPMEVVGNGTGETILSGGAMYLAGNKTLFSALALDGKVFGGFQLSDGWNECGGISLSFNDVIFTDNSRVFGGADVSGDATASVGNITLGMEAVDGGAARVFGAGRVAGEAALVAGDIGVTISCDDGGSFSNFFAGAEAKSGFEGTITCGDVSTVIDGGKFTYCGNGSQLRGGVSEQGNSTLTINGGEFNYFVYAGAFSAGGAAMVDGNSALIINGGTFNSHVFGGCGATNSENGTYNTYIDGNVSVTVDASDNAVSFAGNLYAGSIGEGAIGGSTTMTFTGDGANLSFDANSYVTGGSQMSKNVPEFIGGTATLAFDGFSGDFSANVNNGFTKVAVSNSNVSFTGQTVFLGAVSDWAIEVTSEDAELTIGHGKNNFAGDTLSLTLADGAAPSSDGWDVIAGTDTTLAGWNAFSSVSLCGEDATFTDGEWINDNYRLYREGNVLKLASRA